MSDDKQHGGRRLAAGEPKKGSQRLERLRLWFQNKRNRRIVIAAALVLAVVIGAAAGLSALFQRPTVGNPDVPKVNTDENGDVLDDGEEPVVHSGDRKEDFFTFLVVGRDTAGGGNTDTILLAAYDVKNQKLNVMSIPRDTMVNIPYDIKRINAVYNYNGGGDEGMQALCDEISQLVGFVPDYQIVVEWEAVGELVDAIGGVYFDVPVNMDYDDSTPGQDLHIHVQKGYQLLDGDTAMGVVRWRKNNTGTSGGDVARIAIQQDFLKAVVEQCLQIKNVTKIGELAQIFVEHVTTELTVPNLFWFAQQAIFGGLSMDNVNFVTMPYTAAEVWSRTYQNYQSYVMPAADELVELVNECFNPYEDDLTASELDIMSVNKNGSLSSSTGRVEDTRATGAVTGSGSSGGSTNTTPPAETVPAETTAPEETVQPSASPSPSPSASSAPSTPSTTAPETPAETVEPTPPSAEPSTPAETTAPVETQPAATTEPVPPAAVNEEDIPAPPPVEE